MALNIIFMGTPNFAVPILRALNNSMHKVLTVYTQPPKKRDRGLKESLSPVHKYSKELKLKVRYPKNFDTEEIENIINLKPDVVLVVAYGKILPKELLSINNIKFLNVHPSLLPRWRGAAPIQRAIMNLDKETGVSIMKVISELDAGPIMMQSKIDLTSDTSYLDLSSKLSELGSKMILRSFELIEKKEEKFISQNKTEVTYAEKISKEEAKINWNNKAKKIIAQINALNPNPGSWFKLNDFRIKPIKVKEVKINGIPGEILKKDLTIACSENSVQVIELQKEGKNPMTVEEFIKGNEIKVGQNLNI